MIFCCRLPTDGGPLGCATLSGLRSQARGWRPSAYPGSPDAPKQQPQRVAHLRPLYVRPNPGTAVIAAVDLMKALFLALLAMLRLPVATRAQTLAQSSRDLDAAKAAAQAKRAPTYYEVRLFEGPILAPAKAVKQQRVRRLR